MSTRRLRPEDRRAPPPALYKYLHREHAERMVTLGEVRVGTLYAFRDEERLGPEIGDRDEGRTRLVDRPPAFEASELHRQSRAVRANIVIENHSGNLVMAGNTFVQNTDATNAFIYCLTMEYSPQLKRDFDRDTVVQIDDVQGFFDALTNALLKKHPKLGPGQGAPCTYDGRHRTPAMPDVPAAYVKEARYAYQKEFRLAWPHLVPPAPFEMVQSAAIAVSCTILK